jgi:hypothetical protein
LLFPFQSLFLKKILIMKTLLFFLALTAVTFSSCKKSSDATATVNLSVTIDGTSRTFNNSLSGSLTTTGGSQGLQIIGWSGTAGSSDALYVSVLGTLPLTAKTYAEGAGANIQFIPAGAATSYANGFSPTNPISITITSITSNSAAGTFAGDIFLNANSSSTKKVLTNGSFNVTF